MYIVEGVLERELKRVITEAMPGEACGLITDDFTMVLLTNQSGVEGEFQASRDEILKAVSTVRDVENVAFWHSHPGGGIGPSTFDLQHKTPFNFHCVLAVVDGELVPTWY